MASPTFSRQMSAAVRRLAACVLLTVGLVLGSGAPVQAAGSSNTVPALGVDLSSGFYDMTALGDFDTEIGVSPGIVQNFIAWSYETNPTNNEFPYWRVKDVLATGAVPEITWDPTINGDSSLNQPQMSLASIADGDYDAYIRSFAQSAASVGGPVLLRFAHEMNGSWTTYAESNSGNHPGDFVAAWRHVWRIFQSVGATNVQWIWSPNIVSPGDTSLAELYPGDAYVDWVGLDGYSYPLEGCQTAAQEFTPAIDEIEKFTTRPMMLAEIGVAEQCPNKPALIEDLFSWLESQPEIHSITWWERDDPGSNDLIESDAAALTAFKSGLQGWEGWLADGDVGSSPAPASSASDVTVGSTSSATSGGNEQVSSGTSRGGSNGSGGPAVIAGTSAAHDERATTVSSQRSVRLRVWITVRGARSVAMLLPAHRRLTRRAHSLWQARILVPAARASRGVRVTLRVVTARGRTSVVRRTFTVRP